MAGSSAVGPLSRGLVMLGGVGGWFLFRAVPGQRESERNGVPWAHLGVAWDPLGTSLCSI